MLSAQLRLPTCTATILDFTSVNFRFSEAYRIELHVTLESYQPSLEWMKQSAALWLQTDGAFEPMPFLSGIVTSVSHDQLDVVDGVYPYKVTLESPMALLALSTRCQVWSGNLRARVMQLLNLHGYALNWHVQSALPEIDNAFALQYHETDAEFLHRALRRFGLLYTWAYTEGAWCLTVYDTLYACPSSEYSLPYSSGMIGGDERITDLQYSSRNQAKTVTVRDYNPATHQPIKVSVATTMTLPSVGEVAYTQELVADSDMAHDLARRRLDALDSARIVACVATPCATIQLGDRVTLPDAPYQQAQGEYRVVGIDHQFDVRAEAFATPGYQAVLTLIPSTVTYRPSYVYPQKYPHLATALIESGSTDKGVSVDNEGQYRLRLTFDNSHLPKGQASPATPISVPLTGPQYGWHFPLPVGTEVAVQFINGDINRPFIVGAVPTLNNPTTVTNQNPSQHIINTFGGHQLLMDDKRGQEKFVISTPHKLNQAVVDATQDNESATLTSTGDVNLTAKTQANYVAKGDAVYQVGGNETRQVQGRQTTTTSTGNITQSSGDNFIQSAQSQLNFTAQTGSFTQNAGQALLQTANKHITINTAEGNLLLSTSQGTLAIQSAKALSLIAPKKLIISQGQGTITIENGNLTIQAPRINFDAPNIVLSGQQVQLGGQYQLPRDPNNPMSFGRKTFAHQKTNDAFGSHQSQQESTT